ncbi:transcriptional regulator, AraC family [Arthrobacter sp. yr096]|uniref:AraC family transcriptional regulator n=1 Tax=unclassified Arthrobacter TaxID=235627 RepID=UPI00089680B7|nr:MULTISPECIES: AraC family transcriptional regulator [unclassified Arthrobacter]SDX30990.1 transcriptional regulator, AraC family [Arthrobacter sp. cf158]SEJ51876.1 transcriptional regulator, AraC family [Arthrobacter sp. yr096]
MKDSFKGILYPARLPTFHRFPAPGAVADLVEWFWIPEWDIEPGRSSRQHVIPYPTSNLVVQPADVIFSGPTTRAAYRDLTGKGWAVGALLRPAAVPLFTDAPGTLRDTEVGVELGELHAAVAGAMATRRGEATHDDGTHRRRAVEAFAAWLASLDGALSEEALLANRMMDVIASGPEVVLIEDAASRLAVSPRTLQRIARKYVGLSPSALIRRRRLQDAAERARSEPTADLAAIAVELGYADHAHLTNDFQKYLGFTPSTYRRSAGAAEP